jgi:hypothetical protein
MAEEFYIDSMRRRMLPMSLGVSSPGGVLTQNVQAAPALPRSMQLRRQRDELMAQEDDMSALQAYGRQQGEAGQTAMLNALAAQFAGERFEPVQTQFLRRAAAAQQPMRVGKGMVTPDGQFIMDPGARREAQVARMSGEIELADRLEAQAASQAERLQAQQAAQAERLAAQEAQARRDADLRRELKTMGGGGSQPYFQPVQTAQGVYAFNSRLGRMELVAGPDGKPIIGAAADPTLQGAIAGAKTTGSELAKQGTEAIAAGKTGDKLLTALTQAEGILKAGPTGSGAGAALDAAGRAVGVSRDAAVKAGQLETLSGWLVANVPRMEGPQSNFDVQVYTTMAGKVGDRTVPVRERLAALDELRKLQTKYKSLNQGAAPSGAGNLSAAEQAELEALRKKFGR